jgi:hypothetical protein
LVDDVDGLVSDFEVDSLLSDFALESLLSDLELDSLLSDFSELLLEPPPLWPASVEDFLA